MLSSIFFTGAVAGFSSTYLPFICNLLLVPLVVTTQLNFKHPYRGNYYYVANSICAYRYSHPALAPLAS